MTSAPAPMSALTNKFVTGPGKVGCTFCPGSGSSSTCRGEAWAGPLWADAPAFDLSDHVRVVALPAPGDEAQLLLATEQLRRRRLDRSRPLWEMWFLPGLPDARIGLFVRLHHVIADGLRRLIHSRGETVEDLILPIYVPVSVRQDQPGQRWSSRLLRSAGRRSRRARRRAPT